jgi:hypothetical protein
MRYFFMLALFFTCLSAASAADDPVTKRNTDASTPMLIKSPPMHGTGGPQRQQAPSIAYGRTTALSFATRFAGRRWTRSGPSHG